MDIHCGHAYQHTYMHTYILYIHMHLCKYAHKISCVCVLKFVYMYMCRYISEYIYIYIHTRLYVFTQIHLSLYIYIYYIYSVVPLHLITVFSFFGCKVCFYWCCTTVLHIWELMQLRKQARLSRCFDLAWPPKVRHSGLGIGSFVCCHNSGL